MFKYVLDPSADFGIIPMIPLVGFFLIFVGVILWAFLAKKGYISHMSNLPLEDQISKKGEN
jgi:cbb3-type cytochrome oxidase subunit 3